MSHAHADKEISDDVVNILLNGFRVRPNQIFSTSQYLGNSLGAPLYPKLHEAINKTTLGIFIITHNFSESHFCRHEASVLSHIAETSRQTNGYSNPLLQFFKTREMAIEATKSLLALSHDPTFDDLDSVDAWRDAYQQFIPMSDDPAHLKSWEMCREQLIPRLSKYSGRSTAPSPQTARAAHAHHVPEALGTKCSLHVFEKLDTAQMLARVATSTTIRISTTWTPILARESVLSDRAVNGAFEAFLYAVDRRAHAAQLTIELLLSTRDGPAAQTRSAELPGFDRMLVENYRNAQTLIDLARRTNTLNVYVKLNPFMPELSYHSVDEWTDFGFFLPKADASESLRYRVTSSERAGAHLRQMFHRAWNRASNIPVRDLNGRINSSEIATGLGDIKWTC